MNARKMAFRQKKTLAVATNLGRVELANPLLYNTTSSQSCVDMQYIKKIMKKTAIKRS